MMIMNVIRALRLIRKMEDQGLVSAVMPEHNFLISPKIDHHLVPDLELALTRYAATHRAISAAINTTKVIALIAAIMILVKHI